MSDFHYSPPNVPLEIVRKDGALLLINKPSGLLSVPGKKIEHSDCLESRVKAEFPEALLVHRLDLGTSGVMVFALTRGAQRNLGIQFEKRLVRKSYIARVLGRVAKSEGRIELPIAVDWPNRPKQKIDPSSGKSAATRWRIVCREEFATRLNLFPETGRSHQLRVHLHAIGHPVLGDRLYFEGESASAAVRLQLHAESLEFRHPEGGKLVKYKVECPF
ncbi:MAG: pseudouridine synthase [Albidovulum sp.]|nr:pseudouridine synthase [Albidovulum sp.]MDE0306186.1 pseudouridine synthase [Albidovulum sp.]MDE0530325.1 pseudouridine synthase [Albidovulum sp.]